MRVEGETAPAAQTARASEGHLPVLTWLSLAESLPSVARRCFTRQVHCTKDSGKVTGEDSRKIDAKDST
jgi:hypothetical protein